MIWCGHCPASRAQIVVALGSTPREQAAAHIASAHPGTGEWIEGEDWCVLDPDTRAALLCWLEHLDGTTSIPEPV